MAIQKPNSRRLLNKDEEDERKDSEKLFLPTFEELSVIEAKAKKDAAKAASSAKHGGRVGTFDVPEMARDDTRRADIGRKAFADAREEIAARAEALNAQKQKAEEAKAEFEKLRFAPYSQVVPGLPSAKQTARETMLEEQNKYDKMRMTESEYKKTHKANFGETAEILANSLVAGAVKSGGGLVDIAKATGAGAKKAFAGITDPDASFFGEFQKGFQEQLADGESLYDTYDQYYREMRERQDRQFGTLNTFTGYIEQAAHSVGEMAPVYWAATMSSALFGGSKIFSALSTKADDLMKSGKKGMQMLGRALGKINAGSLGGATAMFVSSSAQSTKEAYRGMEKQNADAAALGKPKKYTDEEIVEKSALFGFLDGISEVGLDYAIGGITGTAGSLLPQGNVKNPFLTAVLAYLKGAFGEGFEEGVQTLASLGLKKAIYDPEAEIDWREVRDSAIVGMITGVGVGAPSFISNTTLGASAMRDVTSTAKATKNVNTDAQAGVIASVAAAKAKAYGQMAEQVRSTDSENADTVASIYEWAAARQQEIADAMADDAKRKKIIDENTKDTRAAIQRMRDTNPDFAETERTGRASGAKAEDIRMAGELSTVLGKKIRFFREDAKNGTINNGEYHEDTGEIWINTRSKNVKAQIVAHELTHSIEKKDSYQQLVDLAMNKLEEEQKAKGKTLDDLYREKETLYADGGVRLASYDEITSELVAEFVEKRLLTDEASIKSLVSENRTLGQRIREWFDSLLAKMGNASAKEREYIRQLRDVYAEALGEGKTTESVQEGGTKYSFAGVNDNGIEVYETSRETMKLNWNERKKKYLDLMRDEYQGRTAKFVRNGHVYYAQYDPKSLRKPIYGDNRSSPNGVRALVKAGADGDFFDLVENAKYTGSAANIKDHTNADYFDYYVKTVQIDGKTFDLMADVEKNYSADGGYVYTLALVDNKKIKASPAHGTPTVPVNNAGNASVDSISQDGENVKGENAGNTPHSISKVDDQRYKDAVDRGDMETAQRMVEEAARAAGYNTTKVYHGSHEKFNSFSHDTSGGLFNFAERPENAEAYALGSGGGRNQTAEQLIAVDENGTAWEYDPDADVYEAVGYWSDDLEGAKLRPIREADKGKILDRDVVEGNLQDGDGNGEYMMVSKNANVGSYYLHMEKTLDLVGDPKTANSVFRGIAEKVFANDDAPVEAKQVMQRILWSGQNAYRDFWTVTKSEHATKVFEKFIVPELKKLGYDSLYHPDDSHKTYAVFDENQIKSADNITYDDNGNVIPLSERFKRDNDDIRHSVSRVTQDSDGRQLSEGQQEYFRDSKVTDANGNLKVMYHGTTGEGFTVFDKRKAKSSGTFGNGFYFSDSKSHAGQYGKTYEVYLNITNPLTGGTKTITRKQMRDFVEAVAENEDYGIENYGYGATVDSVARSLSSKSDFEALMDINITCIGNMAEALQLFGEVTGKKYDGIITPMETVVFDPEQIKNVDNLNPTSDPDIRYSVSRDDASVTEAETDQTLQQIRNDIAADEARYRELSDIVMSNERFNAMMPDEQNAILDEMQSLRKRIDDANLIVQDMSYEGDAGEDVPMPGDEDVYQSTAEQGMYDDMEAEYAELIRDKRKEDADKRTKQKAKDRRVEERLNRQYEDALTWRFGDQTPISEERIMEDAWTVESMGEREFLREQEFGYRDMMQQMDEDAAEQYKEWQKTKKQERAHLREVEDDLNRQFEQAEKERREFNRRQREEDRQRQIERGEIKTVAQRLEENLRNAQLERSDIEQMRRNAAEEYQMILDDVQDRYDALKNKNTAEANTLLRRIARIESRARNEEAAYRKRIYDIDEKIGRIKTEIQNKESPTEQGNMRRDLHESILYRIKERFKERGFDFDKVLAKAKDLSTFATVDNTPQRVMEKALGYKEGNVLADLTVNQTAKNETEGIRWLNQFTDRQNGVLAKLSKKYNIKPGSKESAAAQMYAEGFYVDKHNEIVEYGDRELAADFPDAQVQKNIKGLAHDPIIRQIYDQTLDAINESRVRNAYPEIQKLDNYYLHFRAMDDTFSRIGIPFNPNDIRAKDLPTDINGVTADLKPGQPYFESAQHRQGKRTSFDLLGGLEKYLTSAKNQIYHIDDIQTLRALRNYIADMYGQAHGLEGLDSLDEDAAQARIKEVYDAHLATFAKFLNEEANILAGKTALIDRGWEGLIGRRGITFLNDLNRQVGANMVGWNVSSSLTNFLAPVQAFAKTNKLAFIKGFAQTVENRMKLITGNGDDFAQKSDVMVRRKGADQFHRTAWQKVSDPGYWLMGMVDDISTEIIARAKYNELTAKGMDAETANRETDKWVSRLMGDRSLGQMPQIFNSKFVGLFVKFQLEVRNQIDSQFYDTIKEAEVSTENIENAQKRNAIKAAKIASTIATLAVSQHIFGKVFESIAGYNPAFDIIEVIATAIGLDDDEESEDTVLDNIEQGVLALIEDMPYSSVVMDGGRIPISSALPISELVTGEDQYGNGDDRYGGAIQRAKTLAGAVPYYVLPGGYGQIKKTAQGLAMFGGDKPVTGSYTDSGNLRFPVEATPGNVAQAAVFGQWANENARDYFDNERSPISERQAQGYAESWLEWRDYQKYKAQITKLQKDADKVSAIKELDISTSAKEALYRSLVASAVKDEDGNIIGSSEDDRISALYGAGLDFEDFLNAKQTQSALNANKELTANQRASRYLSWIANEGYEGQQAKVLAEQFSFASGFKAEPATYKKLIDGGVTSDNAIKVSDALAGKTKTADKIDAVWSTGLSGEQLDRAVKSVLSEKAYERYRIVVDANIPLEIYTWALLNADQDADGEKGHGSVNNTERELILSQLALPRKDLSALWLALGGSEKSNPYRGASSGSVPKVEVPKISVPKVEVPKIELPKIELPKIGG